jgi:hypothetical protein
MRHQVITHTEVRQLKPATAGKLRKELQRLAAHSSPAVQRFLQQMRQRHPEMSR